MDYSDLLKSALGAVIGFFLAQVVNLAKIAWDIYRRPRLVITHPDSKNWRVLMHDAQVGLGETYAEEIYAFYVCNVGRRIATGVRFQLIKIEYRGVNWLEFADASEQTCDLAVYTQASANRGAESITLVPGAKTLVHLASWREDYDVVFPAVATLPDYFEEICTGATEFRFTVVVFDDHARFTTAIVTIRTGSRDVAHHETERAEAVAGTLPTP